MEYIKRGDFYALRLDKGEEIIESLTNFCKKEALTAAYVSGIGAVNHAEIGCFNSTTKQYHKNVFDEDLEILLLSGNLTRKNKTPYIHAHITLANSAAQTFGGHLNNAIVSVTCELLVQTIGATINRELDEKIGINLMKFDL